jgi:hypothetical protein
MLNQFSRTELLLGKEAMDILENSRVAVFGAADNVYLWSKRKGFDPRTSFTGSPSNEQYAFVRTISGGITLQF